MANFIPAVNGIANLAPSKITFRMAGLITSGFALVIGGLWTAFISNFGIGGFVNTLGATLAPLYGILIVDYYLLRKQKLDRDALYNMDGGEYHYGNGWNEHALVAFAIAAIFSIATVWIPALEQLSGYAWVIGAVLGGVIFYYRSRGARSA